MSSLTVSQQQVVNHVSGNAVVLAVAGAGKTTTLVQRAAKLMGGHFLEAPNILMLTFTKKAAEEMALRATKIAPAAACLEARTFHSWCLRALRQFETAFQQPDILMDERFEWQQAAWAEQILKVLPMRGMKAKDVLQQIAGIKNKGCHPKRIWDTSDPLCAQLSLFDKNLYEAWWKHQAAAGKYDFDDLIIYTLEMLRSRPDVRARIAGYYAYVMVDEYQDTNPAQELVLELICACPHPTLGPPIRSAQIMVVGDDDQSIYAFRGAQPDFIINFQTKWDAVSYAMEDNFRSHNQILDVANSVIKRNKVRANKTLKGGVGTAGVVRIVEPLDEGKWVASEIKEALSDTSPPRDFAVLYRTNAQACMFESALTDAEIPYVCEGSHREGFYGIPEVKTLLNYLRLAHTPTDFEALSYVWNRPTRFLKKTDLIKAKQEAATDDVSDVLDQAAKLIGRGADKIETMQTIINAARVKKCTSRELLVWLMAALEYDKYIRDIAAKSQRSEDDMLSCVQQMLGDAGRRPNLPAYLKHVDLMIANAKRKDNGNTVRLMTLHRVKGLEFPRVFFAGFNEDFIPHPKGTLEEERRLAYVGITRAIQHLSIISKENKQSQFFPDLGLPVSETHHASTN